MKPDWFRILAHYFLIAVIVTVVVLLGVTGARVLRVQRGLSLACASLADHRPGNALAILRSIEPDASLHGALLRRLDVAAVKACAALGDDTTAERIATDLKRRVENPVRIPAGAWVTLYAIPDPLIDGLIDRINGGHSVDANAGFDVLAAEQKKRAQPSPHSELAAIARRQAAIAAKTDNGLHPPEPVRLHPAATDASPSSTNAPLAGVRWCLTVTPDAPAYELSGAFLRRLEPGTVLEVSDFRNSSTGRVVICTSMNTARLGAPVLLRESDIEVFATDLAKVNAGEKALRVRRAKLAAELERLRRNPATINPHFSEYQAARLAYNAFWKKAGDLEKNMNAATGEARMRYYDELRRMKGEDIHMAQVVEVAKKKFDDWNSAHPDRGLQSAAARAMQADLAAVESQLRASP